MNELERLREENRKLWIAIVILLIGGTITWLALVL
jgi:hypothetical protein